MYYIRLFLMNLEEESSEDSEANSQSNEDVYEQPEYNMQGRRKKGIKRTKEAKEIPSLIVKHLC